MDNERIVKGLYMHIVRERLANSTADLQLVTRLHSEVGLLTEVLLAPVQQLQPPAIPSGFTTDVE